jgi:hypothetical protein
MSATLEQFGHTDAILLPRRSLIEFRHMLHIVGSRIQRYEEDLLVYDSCFVSDWEIV